MISSISEPSFDLLRAPTKLFGKAFNSFLVRISTDSLVNFLTKWVSFYSSFFVFHTNVLNQWSCYKPDEKLAEKMKVRDANTVNILCWDQKPTVTYRNDVQVGVI